MPQQESLAAGQTRLTWLSAGVLWGRLPAGLSERVLPLLPVLLLLLLLTAVMEPSLVSDFACSPVSSSCSGCCCCETEVARLLRRAGGSADELVLSAEAQQSKYSCLLVPVSAGCIEAGSLSIACEHLPRAAAAAGLLWFDCIFRAPCLLMHRCGKSFS